MVDLCYPTVDSLVAKIQDMGPGCLLYKKDLQKAYRQLYVDPGDIHLLGYTWDNKVFIDVCLAMGIRSAAHLCQCVTSAVALICLFQVLNYLDDLCRIAVKNWADNDFSKL